MLRKFAAPLLVLAFAVGAVFAEEVKGTFVKFADCKLTIDVDGKSKEYKVPSDLKIKLKTKDGEKEFSAAEYIERRTKGDAKPETVLTVDGDKVTDLKMRPNKPKSDK